MLLCLSKKANQTQSKSRSGIALLTAFSMALSACATTPHEEDPKPRVAHAIEGYWATNDTGDIVEIRPCKDDDEKLCGHLIQFDGNPDARDYLHPSWLHWGQKLCDSLIVADMVQTEEPQIYTGSFYDPEEGQIYNLIVLVKTPDHIESRIYHGASFDEAISLGIGALTGDVGVFSTLSFLTRAGIGKEHLGENLEWKRSSDRIERRCDA